MAWDEAEGLPLLLINGSYSFIYGQCEPTIEQINNTTGTTTYLHHDQQGSTRLLTGATVAYEYDAANNPTKIGTGTYKYNAGDELETGPSLTYTYDELGERTKTKPTTGPATTYGYDQAGNLTSVERPKEGETAEIKDTYAYDGNGLRASQTISGTTTYMVWDMTEGLPLILSDGTNSYIYGPGGLPIEQISSGGTVTYLHHDQQGSTRLLTGSTGTVTGKCTYGAYGTPTCEGTSTTPLGYDGQYTNTDTGLIYMRARVYDPATAQFLNVDPVVSITRAPYNYGEDNPLNRDDRSGLSGGLFEGELHVPCLWPCGPPPPGASEAIGGAIHAGEGIWNAITEHEGPNDEGEAELREKEAEREGDCGEIPREAINAEAGLKQIAKETEIPRGELSKALHEAKEEYEMPANGKTRIDPRNGDIYDAETGEHIGNVFR